MKRWMANEVSAAVCTAGIACSGFDEAWFTMPPLRYCEDVLHTKPRGPKLMTSQRGCPHEYLVPDTVCSIRGAGGGERQICVLVPMTATQPYRYRA